MSADANSRRSYSSYGRHHIGAVLSGCGKRGHTTANYRVALAYVDCMRPHGVPNCQDPNPTNPDVVHPTGVDPSSPQFQGAHKAWESLVPGTGSK